MWLTLSGRGLLHPPPRQRWFPPRLLPALLAPKRPSHPMAIAELLAGYPQAASRGEEARRAPLARISGPGVQEPAPQQLLQVQ